MAKTKKEVSLDQPFLHTVDGQGVNSGFDGSKYARSLTPGESAQEVMGQSQGFWDSTANILGRFAGRALIGTVETGAMLSYGIPKAIQTGDFSKIFDNDITKSIGKIDEKLVKNTPFYQTQAERETQYDSISGVLSNMSTTNFWGNALGEGAGFVASAVFGGRMIGAVGSALNRGIKSALTTSRLGRAIAGAANAGEELGMFSKALEEGKLTDKVNSFLRTNKIKDAAAFHTQSILGNMYEAGVEAKGIKEEILAKKLEEYKEQFNGAEPPESVKIGWENEVNPIANVGFAANLALLQIEGLGINKFLKGYKESRRTIKALQEGENYVAKGKWGKVFDRSKDFLGGSLKEAAQEGGQYTVEKGLTGDFSDKKLSEQSIADYYNAVVKGFEKTFNSKEGIESMIIGGMLGLPGGAVNAYQGAKGDAYGIDILNKNLTRDGIAPILANTNRAILENEGNQIEDFADASSKYLFKSAQDSKFYNYVDAHLQSGRFNDLMDKLYERKNMDLSTFNEIAGTDYTESKRHEVIDDLMSSAERIKKTTENVESTYDKHPFKSSIIRILSDLSSYDKRIKGIQSKLTTESDPLVREQLGSDLAFLISDKKKSETILHKLITSKVDLKNVNADPRDPTPNEDKAPEEPNDPNAPEKTTEETTEETGLEGMSQEDIDSMIGGKTSIEDFKGKTVKVNGEDVVIEGQKEDGTFRGASKSGPKDFTSDEIERGNIAPFVSEKDPNFDEDEDNFEDDDLEEKKNEDLFNKSFVLDLDNPENSDFMHWSDFQLKDHDTYVRNFPADKIPSGYQINNQEKALSVKNKIINSMGKLADTHRIVVKKDGKNANVFAIDKDGNKTHIGYFLNSELNAKKKGGSLLNIGEFFKQYFETSQGKRKLSTDKNGRSRLLEVFSAWSNLTSSDKETDITDHVRMLSYIDNRADGNQTTLKEIAESEYADRWKINGEFVIVANDNGNYFPLKNLSVANKKLAIESLKNNKLMGSLDTQYGILVKRPDSKAYQFIGLRGAKIEDSQKQEYIKRINNVASVEEAEELANELNNEVFLATNRKIVLEDGVGYKVHLKFHAVKSGFFKGKIITLAVPKRINGKAQEGVSFKGQQFKMYTAEEAMKMLATKRIFKDESQYQDVKFLTNEYLTTSAQPNLWKTMFRFNHASFIGAEPNKKSDAFTPIPPVKTKPQVTQEEFNNIYTKVSGLFKDIDLTGFLPNENYEEDELPIVNDPEYVAWYQEKNEKANSFFKDNKVEEGQKVNEEYYEKLKDIIKKKLNIDIETKTSTSSAVVQTEVEKQILNNQKAILGKTADKDADGNKIDSYYVIATGNTDKYETFEVLDESGNLKKVKGEKFNRVSNVLPNNFDGDSSLYNNSRTAGNTIDSIIRNFFNKGITTKPDGISQGAFNNILSELKEMKKDLDAAGQRFLANNIVLWDPKTGIAGELDILSIDKNGRFSIYDIKTAKKGKFESYDKSFGNKPSKRKEHSLQLSAYSNLIYNQYGINISGLSIIPIELEYDENGVISNTNRFKNFVLNYDADVNKYVSKASENKDVKNNIPPADKQYSIVSIDTRVNFTGWTAAAELAKIAYNEGVNLVNLTREEYANYAIKHFLKIDDNLLRASRKLRTAISTAQQVHFLKELKNSVSEASDKSFAKFAVEISKIASEVDANNRVLFSDNKKVRVRSGNNIGSSWLYFGVNSGLKEGDVFKSYAEFTDINKIYVNDFKNFLKELQKRGYNGDVKIFSDSKERGAPISDHLVMHGASKEDAILGKEIAEGFFRDKIFTTSLGKDEIINGKMKSYSEVLAMKIAETVDTNFKNYNPPKENKPTPPPTKPDSPSSKANPFVLSDEELDAAQNETKGVDLGNITPSDSSKKQVDDFLPGEDELNEDEEENERKLKPAFEGDTKLVNLDNSIKDALAKITGLEVRFYDSPYNYGEFRNGIIYLNKKVPKGTEWHEAFHGIFSVLSPEERKRVLTIAFNKWGVSREEAQDLRDIYMERTGKDIFLTKGKQWVIDTILEEKIADHFQEFMVDNKKPTVLESFFNKLKKLINSLLGIVDQPAFQGFFTEIANGQFKDRQYVGTKGKLKDVRFKVIPGARTVAESRKLIRDITVLYKNRNKKEVLDGLPELVSAPRQMEAFVKYYIDILKDKFDANKRNQVAKIIESYETGKITEDQYNLLKEAEANYTKTNLAKENGKFFPKYLREKNISMITNEVIRRGNFVEVEGLDEFDDDDGNHTFFDAHNMESNPKVQRAARSVEGRISDMFFFDDMGNIMTFEGNKVMNNLFHNLSNLNREDYKNALGKLSIGNTDYAKIMKQVYTAYKNEPDFKAQFDTAFDNRFVKAIMLVSSKHTRGTQGRIITANSKNHEKIQMDLWKNESFNKTLNPNIEEIYEVPNALGITLEKSTLSDEDGIKILEELKDSIQPAQSQPVVDFIKSKRIRDLLEALSEVNVKYRMDLGELNFKNAKDKSMYSIMQNSWALNKLAETGYDFGVFVGSKFSSNEGENKYDYGDLDARSHFFTTFGLYENYYTGAGDKKTFTPTYFISQFEGKKTNFVFKGADYGKLSIEDTLKLMQGEKERQDVNINAAVQELFNDNIPAENLKENYHYFKDRNRSVKELREEAKAAWLKFEKGDTDRNALPLGFRYSNLPLANNSKINEQVVTAEKYNTMIEKQYLNTKEYMSDINVTFMDIISEFAINKATEDVFFKTFLKNQYLNRMLALSKISPDLNQFLGFTDITKRGAGLLASGPSHGDGNFNFAIVEDTYIGDANSTDAQGAESITERINRYLRLGIITQTKSNDTEEANDLKKGYQLLKALEMDDRELVKEIGDDNALLKVDKTVGYGKDQYIKTSVVPIVRYDTSQPAMQGETVTRIINGKNKTFTAIRDIKNGKFYLPYPGKETAWHMLNEMQVNRGTRQEPKYVNTIFAQSAIKKGIRNLIKNIDDEGIGSNFVSFEYKDYRLQQENPSGKEEIKDGSQLLQIIDSFFSNDAMIGNEKLKNLSDTMDRLVSELKLHGYEFYGDDIEVEVNGQVYNPFMEYIKNAMQGSHVNDRIQDFFQIKDGKMVNSPNLPMIKIKYEEYLMSYYNKKIASHKVPGNKSTLVTSIFHNTKRLGNKTLTQYEYDELLKNDPNEAKKVQSSRLKWVSGDSPYAEAVVSEEWLDQIGITIEEWVSLKKAYENDKTSEDGKMFEKVSTALAYRIPTQSQHSMVPIKIVDILPRSYGSTILLPAEITSISGADYDVDSVFIHRHSVYKKGKKLVSFSDNKESEAQESYMRSFKNNSVVQEIFTMLPSQQRQNLLLEKKKLLALRNQRIEEKEKLDEEYIDSGLLDRDPRRLQDYDLESKDVLDTIRSTNARIKDINESLDEVYNSSLGQVLDILGKNKTYTSEDIIREVNYNKLLDIRLKILTSPEGTKLINTPASDLLKPIYNKKYAAVGYPTSESEAEKYLTYSGQDNMLNEYKKVSTGTKAIGGAANINKVASFLQKNGIEITKEIWEVLTSLYPSVNFSSSENMDSDFEMDVVDGKLKVAYDENGKKISKASLKSELLSSNVTCATDNAKDQRLVQFHITDKNISEASVFAMLGIGKNRMSAILLSPIGKRISSILSTFTGSMSAPVEFAENADKIDKYLSELQAKGAKQIEISDENLIASVQDFNENTRIQNLLKNAKFTELSVDDKLAIDTQYSIGMLYKNISAITADCYKINTILNFNKTIGRKGTDIDRILAAYDSLEGSQGKPFSFGSSEIKKNRFVDTVKNVCGNLNESLSRKVLSYSPHVNKLTNNVLDSTISKSPYLESLFTNDVNNKFIEFLGTKLFFKKALENGFLGGIDLMDKQRLNGTKVINAYRKAVDKLQTYAVGKLFIEINFDKEMKPSEKYPFPRIGIDTYSNLSPEDEQEVQESFDKMAASTDPIVSDFVTELFAHVAIHDNYKYLSGSIVGKLSANYLTTINNVYSEDLTNLLTSDLDKINSSFEELFGLKSWQVLSDFSKFYFSDNRNKKRVKELSISEFYLRKRDDEGKTIEKINIDPIKVDNATYIVEAPFFAKMRDISTPLLFRIEDRLYIKEYVTDGESFNDPTKGVKKFVYKLVYGIENKITPKVSLHQYVAEESKYLLEEALATLREKLNSKKEEAAPEPNNQFNLDAFEGIDMEGILGMVESFESMQENIQEGPVEPKGEITLDLIEDWVQEGKATTTVRSSKNHNFFYQGKGDGVYLEKTSKKPYNITYKGTVYRKGDMIYGDRNFKMSLDEFAQKEGWQSWEAFSDYKTGAKYAGRDLIDRENFRVHMYNISPSDAEIKMPQGSTTELNIFYGTGENADLSNFAERPFENAEGITFKNVEAAFQYAKTYFATEDNSEIKARLQNADGPTAKAIGKQIKGLNTQVWDNNSIQIMKDLIKTSFIENPSALSKLVATGNATLTHTQDKSKWGTEFPKILMEVRNELRGSQPVVNTTNEPKGQKVKDGIYVNEAALTKEEQLELFNYLKPYLEEQAAKTNKGADASKMIGLGLRWDYKTNNPGKVAMNIPDVINPMNQNKYGYYNTSINGQPLAQITPRFRELMQKASGVDMSNYDGAIINLYEANSFISSHNDVDESKSAIKYPVIGVNIGGTGNFSIESRDNDPKLLDLPAGTAYVFGFDGVNRDVFHRTFAKPQYSFLPELTTKLDGKTHPAGSYRITITMRRVMPLESSMPITPTIGSVKPTETIKEKTSGTSNPYIMNAEDLEDFINNPDNASMDLSTKPLSTTGETSSVSQEGEKLYQEYVKKGGKEDKNKFLSLSKDVQQKMIDCL
jgi:predicted NAD-dependent protein-ADP-ribosyltransferase YbiA (DUF1768 family)/alkylated DNA repair dioxygenase AlkB